MIANCGSGDIVHAGTYFGDFLPALSTGLSSNSKIWAFEPNLENYRCAKITIEINELKKVVLTNAALGAERQKMFMQITDNKGQALGGTSRLIDNTSNEIYEAGLLHSVDVLTVDEAIASDRNVSIIQLDIEGHEAEALAGALKMIKRCLPIIILEVLPSNKILNSNFFSENILSLGYRKIANIYSNYVFSCK